MIKADPLATTREVAKELNMDHSMVIQKQIGKVKELDKWVPHELTVNQKNHHFEVSSSLNLHKNKPFLGLIVTWDKNWILYYTQW